MLTPATLQDIQTYGETVYRLALDPSRASYPAYFDGIKTKAEFFADAARHSHPSVDDIQGLA